MPTWEPSCPGRSFALPLTSSGERAVPAGPHLCLDLRAEWEGPSGASGGLSLEVVLKTQQGVETSAGMGMGMGGAEEVISCPEKTA